jgi:hypothetical protein
LASTATDKAVNPTRPASARRFERFMIVALRLP